MASNKSVSSFNAADNLSDVNCDGWTLGRDVENNPPLLEDMGLRPLDKYEPEILWNGIHHGTNNKILPLGQSNRSMSNTVYVPCDPNNDEFFVFKRRKLDSIMGEDKFNKKLNDEVVLMIFKWLPKFMLVRCAQVCRRWNHLAFDESLWRRLDLGSKTLNAGVIGRVILRGTFTLRLANAEISPYIFSPPLQHIQANLNVRCRLQNLDLSMAAIETQALSILLSVCFELRRVSLEHTTLNVECCNYLARNPNLETLNLAMCYGVNADGLLPMFGSCTKLHSLNVAWTYLTNKDLTVICKNLPTSLLRLNISGCRNTLSDCHIRLLAQRVPLLQELDVSDAGLITEVSVTTLIKKMLDLEYLSMARCFSIPISSYLNVHLMPSLLYLDVYGILNDKALNALRENLPSIKINKYLFSSVARPTVGVRRTSIWGIRVRD